MELKSSGSSKVKSHWPVSCRFSRQNGTGTKQLGPLALPTLRLRRPWSPAAIRFPDAAESPLCQSEACIDGFPSKSTLAEEGRLPTSRARRLFEPPPYDFVREYWRVSFDPKNAVLFLGAGISFDSGAPGFKDLRDFFLVPIIGQRASSVEMRDLSPEQIFDRLDDGRPETRRSIRAALWRACEETEPNPNHFAAAILAGHGAKLWTPNFDTLIERAAERVEVELDTRVDPAAQRGPWPLLNKVHGSFPFTGDPPTEPATHDYELLFSSDPLWNRLDPMWASRLEEDIANRTLYLLGYRGADVDVVPALLDAAHFARHVEWWDLDSENLAHLETLFGKSHPNIAFRRGNPSLALRSLAAPYFAARNLVPTNPPKTHFEIGQGYAGNLSHVSRANIRGQFDGGAAARRELAKGILFDPQELRSQCVWSLARSAGFDIRPVGEALAFTLAYGLRLPRFAKRVRLWVMYASIVDALPLRRADARDLARLAGSPFSATADLLVRQASKRKRQGDLATATQEAEAALTELRSRRHPHPFLEAMVVYNLLWLYRQNWDIARRDALFAHYDERLPHVGFNWTAWITLEQAAYLGTVGAIDQARESLAGPRMAYARATGHPMLLNEADLTDLILDWCEHGSVTIGNRLNAIIERTGRRGSFTHLSALLVRANLESATAHSLQLNATLAEVRRRARSALHLRQADLIEATAQADKAGLEMLANDSRFGLIAETARATQGARSQLVPRDDGPSPALF